VPGPAATSVRVREVQVHNRTVEAAGPGRVALNVVADDPASLERGIVLTSDPAVASSDRLLVGLRSLRPIPGRTAVTLHIGTSRPRGVVGAPGGEAVDFEGERTALLRLDRPVAVAPGDRFAIRRASPVETLAGGRVLDADPPRGVARRRVNRERLAA